MTWRPLSARGSHEAEEAYDALHDGIPEWLKPSVRDWIERVLAALCEPLDHGAYIVAHEAREQNCRALLLSIQRECRLTLEWRSLGIARKDLLEQCIAAPKRGLDVLDFLLHLMHPYHPEFAVQLNGILAQGGSKWCVSAGGDSLEERVAPEVAERAAQVAAGGTRASQHLREAWHSVYGRSPNPSHAYREAVKAVEAAAIPVVSPKDATATLGKVIGTIKATPKTWKVALQPSVGDPVGHVVGVMELLWTAQLDRHGTADPSVPLSVGRDEAEAAVHLALTLVHWFESGAVCAQ